MATKIELLQICANHFQAREFEAAVSAARDVLAVAPNHPYGMRVLGASLRGLGRTREAVQVFRQAAAAHPRDAVILAELGSTLVGQNEAEEAFSLLLASVRIEPKLQAAFLNMGAILADQGRHEESLKITREAIRLKPSCGMSHYNLGNALRELGYFDQALVSFQAAARHQPDLVRATYNLGLLQLLLGDYSQGWVGYEQREMVGEVVWDKYPQPRWDGSSLVGKSLVIHAEQGIGDEVLFASCVPDLIPQAKRLTLICDPRLGALFTRSFPTVQARSFIRRQDQSPAPLEEAHDWQIPAGSLPLFLRPNRESFPRRARFLTVAPATLETWRRRLDALGPGLKIGISWRAGGKAVERRKRSQSLAEWREILTVPGVHFVNLQYSDSLEEREAIREQFGVTVHDWEDADPLVDLDGFAAKLAALDLVISVGNATVHLAGAVGAATWSILPLVPSWRWMAHGDENPWYESVRLFRQTQFDDWAAVLDEVAVALRARVGGGDASSPASGRARSMNKAAAKAIAVAASAERPLDLDTVSAPSQWLSRTDMLGHSVEEHIHHLLDEAEKLQAQKDYAAAEALLREALLVGPKHTRVLNNLGLVAWKTGRLELAAQSFRRALAGVNKTFDLHYNLAAVLAQCSRYDEAVPHYRHVAKLAPRFRPGQLELGLALQRAGHDDQALVAFRAAQSLSPGDFDAYLHEGRSLMRLGRIDEARRSLLKATELEPRCGASWLALGQSFAVDQEYRLAEPCLHRAVAFEPTDPAGIHALADVWEKIGRGADARKLYRAALAGDRPNAKLLLHAADFERRTGDRRNALDLLAKAAAVAPNDGEIQFAFGSALAEQNRLTEAYDCFQRVLADKPDHAPAHVQQALVAMALERWETAWIDYEYRRQTPDVPRRAALADLPLWDGASLAGQTILVRAEQGRGEQLLFATCLPDLIADAGQVLIECDSRLATLFQRAFPQAQVYGVPMDREHLCPLPAANIDWQIPIGSLPRRLRSPANKFPARRAVLAAEPARRNKAARRLAALPPGLRVGFCFEAQPTSSGELRDLAYALEILCGHRDAQFLGLSGRDLASFGRDGRLAPGPAAANVHRFETERAGNDFEDTAAILVSLDLLITDESPLMHLAGGLGVPTWACCLGAPLGCAWLASSAGQSLWYPSVEIVRSQRLGDRVDLAKQLREKLSSFALRLADAPLMGALVGPHWPTTALTAQVLGGR